MIMCFCTWSYLSSPCIVIWCLDPILPSQSAFQFPKHKHAIPYDVTRCKQWTFNITPLHLDKYLSLSLPPDQDIPGLDCCSSFPWCFLLQAWIPAARSSTVTELPSLLFKVDISAFSRSGCMEKPSYNQTKKHMCLYLQCSVQKTKEQMYCQSCVCIPF